MVIKIPKGSCCYYCNSIKFLQRYNGVITCSKHRYQLVRHGKIFLRTTHDKNEIIELRNCCKMFIYDSDCEIIGYSLFDKEDIIKVKGKKWVFDKDGYVVTTVKGRRVLMHRLILDYFGKDDVDHKNHVRYDNRKYNIRVVTRSQNLTNRKSKGVSLDKRNKFKKYRAYITVDKKRIELGLFKTFEEAREVRLKAEKKYFGEYAYNDNRCVLSKKGEENGK